MSVIENIAEQFAAAAANASAVKNGMQPGNTKYK